MSKKPEKENSTKHKDSKKEVKKAPEEEIITEKSKENKEVLQLRQEIEQLRNDKLRLLADRENLRKDFWRQMEEAYKYNSKVLISQVIDFLVDLEERALKAMRNDLEDAQKSKSENQELVKLINKFKGYLKGVKIIKDNLKKRLEDKGVKEIEIKV